MRRVELARKSVDEDVQAVQQFKQELVAARENLLRELRLAAPEAAAAAKTELEAKTAEFDQQVEAAFARFEERSGQEFRKLEERFQERWAAFEAAQAAAKEQKREAETPPMSNRDLAFLLRTVVESGGASLTPRERYLLTFLAARLDSEDAATALAAAEAALAVGQFSQATAWLGKALAGKKVDPGVAERARALQARIEERDRQPAMLEHENPGRLRVGPYGLFDLHLNTLLALVRHGYLTVEEAQQILDEAKRPSGADASSETLSVGTMRYVPVH